MHQHQRARPYEPRSQLSNGLPRPDGRLRKEVAPLQAGMWPSDGRLHTSLTSDYGSIGAYGIESGAMAKASWWWVVSNLHQLQACKIAIRCS